MNRRFFLSLCLCLILSSVALAQPEKLTFDAYHQPGEVNTLLKAWTSGYPQLTKLILIGKSAEQREFFALRVASGEKGLPDPENRPAVFVSANLEGYHLVGTEAALLLAEKLLTRYSSDENIKELLDNNTVYIAPLLNPDVAQAYFSKVRYERRRNGQPVDEDLDDRFRRSEPRRMDHPDKGQRSGGKMDPRSHRTAADASSGSPERRIRPL